jgi:hypothetical protein
MPRRPMSQMRYIGDASVSIRYVGQSRDGRSTYEGVVRVGSHEWPFDDLSSGVGYLGATPDAYDEMAASAVSFASYYTTHNRGDDTPDWAPEPEVADAIDEATSWAMDDGGSYEVRRTPDGPGRRAGEPREIRYPKPARPPEQYVMPRAPHGVAAGQPDDSELPAVIGTLAHNRQFTIRELIEYTHHDRPHIAQHARAIVARLVRDGLLERTDRGRYYPTPKGWEWIENEGYGSISEHRVADFSSFPEIVEHAMRFDGATHVVTGGSLLRLQTSGGTLYIPHAGAYEELRIWKEHGYWHAEAPGSGKLIAELPPGAQLIESYLASRRGGVAERDEDDDDEPEGDDDFDLKTEMETGLVISMVRDGYSLAFDGQYVQTFRDFDAALRAGAQQMLDSNYTPNAFFVNDHGNVDLLHVSFRNTRGRATHVRSRIVRSWV